MRIQTLGASVPVSHASASPQLAPAATPAGTASVPIEVWIPGADGGLDTVAQRSGGPASADAVVRTAFSNGQKVLDYVRREFGRDSFDGRGTVLKLRVHAPDPYSGDPRANNAYWFDDEKRIWLGDGDGETFGPLGSAPDVIAHEFFHGVIDSEVKLSYLGQEGALHESISDVLATGVDGNWQIAERAFTPGIAGDALRDLTKLEHTDWRSFPAWNDEVHAMSEVPSHAAYLVGSRIGMPALRQIWYTALTDYLKNGAGFAAARDATIAAARVLHGALSEQTKAVEDAWAAVGITASTPKERPIAAAPSNAALGAALAVRPLPLAVTR